ncbi:MAG: Fic family protein [Ruminococcaceae bacterium]|nr:Fic family protein [Oscillospiraceae bacterium]
MRMFDYSFLRNGLLPAGLVNLVSGIVQLKTTVGFRKVDRRQEFAALESVARIQSIKSSNAIAGIVTGDQRIADIVNGNSAPLNRNEAEIAGYRDALNLIHLCHDEFDFREQDVRKFHAIMLSFAGYDHGGQYKTEDNVIPEVDADGSRRVRFCPTPAAETKAAMEQLTLAYLVARDDSAIHPLLLIPCVILDFLCVHPFKDGNNRLARLLSLLLLCKNGYDVGKYISFEERINRYQELFNGALQRSSRDWAQGGNDYFPFVENFLTILHICYLELEQEFSVVSGRGITKRAQIEATVRNSLTPLSKAEICRLLPDASPSTVEAVLGAMVRSGMAKKLGQGRSCRYIAGDGNLP